MLPIHKAKEHGWENENEGKNNAMAGRNRQFLPTEEIRNPGEKESAND
jgi:hypothetical protein